MQWQKKITFSLHFAIAASQHYSLTSFIGTPSSESDNSFSPSPTPWSLGSVESTPTGSEISSQSSGGGHEILFFPGIMRGAHTNFKGVISRSMVEALSELCSPFLKGGNSDS